jgi:hypothetical protein
MLAEIERHLEEDRALRRAFGRIVAGRALWARRGWSALLLTCLVLMVGMAALGARTAAVESAALAAVAGVALRLASPRTADLRGRLPDCRP